MLLDLVSLREHARSAYERARVRRALVGASPVVLVAGIAAVFSTRLLLTCGLGLTVAVAGVVLLWRGGGLERVVLPGVLAGLVPLTASLCATRYGHACFGGACMQVCLASSALGGVGAGLLLSRWRSVRETPRRLMLAAGLVLLTGAMGTSCVGLNGVLALSLGLGLSLVAAELFRRLRPGVA